MKKFLMAIFALAVATTVATAGVGIAWTTGWGAYTHDAANNTDDPSAFALLDHYSAIWQLIYAGADNAIDPANLTTGGLNGDYVSDDDVVWAQRDIAQVAQPNPDPPGSNTSTAGDGTSWDNFMYYAGGGSLEYIDTAWSTAGFVYQRVFEGTPGDGTYWYDSPLFAYDETWTDSLSAEGFLAEVDPGAGGLYGDNQFAPAVPEPATMGLLGLGALVMAIRRRRS